MTSRVLVTGAAGFIGAAVARALTARGDEVVALDSGAAAGFGYLDGVSATVVRADLRDQGAIAKAIEGCDSVIHLAAQTSVPDSIADPVSDLRINVDASVSLLEAMRSAGIRRIVFASSNAVVGGHRPPSHERLTPSPVSPYGAAKASIESYLKAYCEAYGTEGAALRFANAYGPWSAHKGSVVAAFTKAYLRGRPLTIRGSGGQTRDYIHVHDLAAAVLLCLDASPEAIAGKVFQIGTGVETSLLELAHTLFEVGGNTVEIKHEPASPGDVARNVSDIRLASDILGFTPHVNLRDGLASTLEWFRGNWHG